LENGLLQIELMRKLPEAMKPRRIAVNAGDGNDHQQIEHSQAA
jgi:molecular chaperone IbpA